ncbi:MAG: heavy-metal-associated domain-containing protein [Thermoleophilia bacterium]|nr:heavy-metal-associated domain-containing protein [Thermoleophilia bacterium]
METRVYRVSGMTCAHCERAVETEVRALPSVSEVSADAAAETVRVAGADLTDDAVRAAIVRAGYEPE